MIILITTTCLIITIIKVRFSRKKKQLDKEAQSFDELDKEIPSFNEQVKKAMEELKDLCADTRRFLPEEAQEYKNKYSSLYSECCEKALQSKWYVSNKIKEKPVAASFLVKYRMVDELCRENNLLRDRIEQADQEIETYWKELRELLDEDHYFSYSECEDFKKDIKDFKQLIATIYHEGKQNLLANKEKADFFNTNTTDVDNTRRLHNDQFVAKELSEKKVFFDTALAYPLDHQQRESIVKLEDNCLVVASAGSGKTSTMMGKIKYLTNCRNEDPEGILTITYTRKAAEELSGRLNNKRLKCQTFHKLAMDIIGETTGRKPSISEANLFLKVFYKQLEEPVFKNAVVEYLIKYQNGTGDSFKYDSTKQYVTDRRKFGNQALFPDAEGKFIFTKSEEEKKLVSYLTKLGVKFKYETAYPFATYDNHYRQYRPDFTIYYTDIHGEAKCVYLEHFGINEWGNVPKWFGNGTLQGYNRVNEAYKRSVQWKKKLHEKNGTKLIYTTSADFHNKNVEERLEEMLLEIGVPIHKLSDDELYDMIMKRSKSLEKSVMNTCQSFIFLMKSNERSLDQVLDRARRKQAERDVFIINRIMRPLYDSYQHELNVREEQDFTDVILEATEICKQGRWRNYHHILVDEFQDISIDRYKFLLALRKGTGAKPAKLYCVGDDWQSIYRFSGSDMSLFSQFSNYFGYTEECRIETTYRFGYPLIGVSSNFIMKNPMQKKKNVSPRMVPNPDHERWLQSETRDVEPEPEALVPLVKTEIEYMEYLNDNQVYDKIAEIVKLLPKEKSIYILSRYSYDAQILGENVKTDINTGDVWVEMEGRRIRFLTVHSSKGLEADYVFLLNCNAGIYGFPSQVADDPVMEYVLSQNDTYDFAEERRVFYVGITRAKTKTYVMYNEKKPSIFVTELTNVAPEEAEICPICKCGHKVVAERTAKNGTTYRVVSCSNAGFGCPYYAREFDNQNNPKPGYRNVRYYK